jgi:AraC-like DNA-binding protein
MRIILPTSFSRSIAQDLKSLQFDILASDATSLTELSRLSARERRILFIRSDLLPEGEPGHRDAHGIIALGPSAQTPDGFRKFVLPHLAEASESQFERHITFLNGSGGVEVVHLVYENQKVQEQICIPRGTNEQFLHFATHGLRELRSKGILLAGFTRTLDGYMVERRPAAFHVLGVVLHGQLEFSADPSDVQRLEAKCTFLIPAGTHCTYRATSPTEFLWLHIHTHAFGGGLGDEFRSSNLLLSDDLIDYCRHFRSEARSANPDRNIALSHLAALMELALRRNLAGLGMDPHPDESLDRLKKALRSFEDSPASQFSITDLARLTGVSTSRLYRNTQRYFDKSPGTLIEEIRIRHARELLLHSDYKLEKIAEMTGYSDAFSFSRAFKRLAGTSPSLFRKGLG